METDKHDVEYWGEMRSFHLEIKERLARIETKQDGASACYDRLQAELIQLYAVTGNQGKDIAALNGEIQSFKWVAGVVAGLVTGIIQLVSYSLKGGK